MASSLCAVFIVFFISYLQCLCCLIFCLGYCSVDVVVEIFYIVVCFFSPKNKGIQLKEAWCPGKDTLNRHIDLHPTYRAKRIETGKKETCYNVENHNNSIYTTITKPEH